MRLCSTQTCPLQRLKQQHTQEALKHINALAFDMGIEELYITVYSGTFFHNSPQLWSAYYIILRRPNVYLRADSDISVLYPRVLEVKWILRNFLGLKIVFHQIQSLKIFSTLYFHHSVKVEHILFIHYPWQMMNKAKTRGGGGLFL